MADPRDAVTRHQAVAALAHHRGPAPLFTALTLAADSAIWAGAVYGILSAPWWWAKSLFVVVAAIAVSRLFLTGHDACHGASFSSAWANRCAGRLAFLPSLTPFSTWELGHNTLHHGFTNLRGKDYVYTPFSKAEFDALPEWRRFLERIYRSPAGPSCSYLVEIWWKKLWFPRPSASGGFRLRYLLDSLLTAAFAVALTLACWRTATGNDRATVTAVAVLGPFVLWNAIMGFVTYQHHTSPATVWYRERSSWEALTAQVDNTPHLEFRWPLGPLLGNIMDHTAHHVDVRISMFRLPAAQRDLETILPGRVAVIRWSWHYYTAICRRCKLFDYENQRWLDFDGRAT